MYYNDPFSDDVHALRLHDFQDSSELKPSSRGFSRSGPLGVIHWGYNTEYRCAKQRENISHPPSDGYGVASLHDNDTDAPEVESEAFRSLLNNRQADQNGALDYLLD